MKSKKKFLKYYVEREAVNGGKSFEICRRYLASNRVYSFAKYVYVASYTKIYIAAVFSFGTP